MEMPCLGIDPEGGKRPGHRSMLKQKARAPIDPIEKDRGFPAS
jgi:hypothetical protein